MSFIFNLLTRLYFAFVSLRITFRRLKTEANIWITCSAARCTLEYPIISAFILPVLLLWTALCSWGRSVSVRIVIMQGSKPSSNQKLLSKVAECFIGCTCTYDDSSLIVPYNLINSVYGSYPRYMEVYYAGAAYILKINTERNVASIKDILGGGELSFDWPGSVRLTRRR